MLNKVEFIIPEQSEFKQKLLLFSSSFINVALYDSNNYKNSTYDLIAGVGHTSEIKLYDCSQTFNKLKEFYNKSNDWLFGYFSYDLKNDIEKLHSHNNDFLEFPVLHFFVPEYVFELKNKSLIISSNKTGNEIKNLFNIIVNQQNNVFENIDIDSFKTVINKQSYIDKVKSLKNNIQKGDIYEVNFCQEFYTKNANLNPVSLFYKLNKISPVPYAAFYKTHNNYLISASPERFVSKTFNKIISQPIKGTIKRGQTKKEDEILIKELKSDIKERAENVMIVDLVRNDLSKIAKKNSVNVKELFGIYTFPQVHQMISTIEAEVSDEINPVDIIKNLFPMGSMTGAPKISAMQLIENYEETKRGLYSGSVGYFKPNGNFDFNVVIRSLLYNAEKKYLSFQVGSAITIKSDAEKEYEECFVKAKAIFEATKTKLIKK